jgi:8-oxo-dGTP diphosphatase
VTRRATFFDEDDARAVAEQLADAGWSADVARDRFAGEDDDEDHPWAVLTSAPAEVVGPLVEEHDGWLDDRGDDRGDDPGGEGPARPLDLPRGPRR